MNPPLVAAGATRVLRGLPAKLGQKPGQEVRLPLSALRGVPHPVPDHGGHELAGRRPQRAQRREGLELLGVPRCLLLRGCLGLALPLRRFDEVVQSPPLVHEKVEAFLKRPALRVNKDGNEILLHEGDGGLLNVYVRIRAPNSHRALAPSERPSRPERVEHVVEEGPDVAARVPLGAGARG